MSEQRALAVRGNPDLPDQTTWRTMLDMGKALYESGLLPTHIKSPQAAVAVIQKGRELGVPPMYALAHIVYINGKTSCDAELMLALIYRDQGDNALVFARSDNEACTISYQRRGWTGRRENSFTIEDAKRAGLAGTPNWQKYPAAMLRARCISATARMAFPDTIGGMYTTEELGGRVIVTADGEVIYDDAAEAEQPTEATFRDVSEPETPPDQHPDRMTESQLSAVRAYAEKCGVHRINLLNEAKRRFDKVDFDCTPDEGRALMEWCRAQGRARKAAPADTPASEPQTTLFDPEADADLIPAEEPAS